MTTKPELLPCYAIVHDDNKPVAFGSTTSSAWTQAENCFGQTAIQLQKDGYRLIEVSWNTRTAPEPLPREVLTLPPKPEPQEGQACNCSKVSKEGHVLSATINGFVHSFVKGVPCHEQKLTSPSSPSESKGEVSICLSDAASRNTPTPSLEEVVESIFGFDPLLLKVHKERTMETITIYTAKLQQDLTYHRQHASDNKDWFDQLCHDLGEKLKIPEKATSTNILEAVEKLQGELDKYKALSILQDAGHAKAFLSWLNNKSAVDEVTALQTQLDEAKSKIILGLDFASRTKWFENQISCMRDYIGRVLSDSSKTEEDKLQILAQQLQNWSEVYVHVANLAAVENQLDEARKDKERFSNALIQAGEALDTCRHHHGNSSANDSWYFDNDEVEKARQAIDSAIAAQKGKV